MIKGDCITIDRIDNGYIVKHTYYDRYGKPEIKEIFVYKREEQNEVELQIKRLMNGGFVDKNQNS